MDSTDEESAEPSIGVGRRASAGAGADLAAATDIAEAHGSSHVDYRFSLANERTFLAWTRTALALIAGGLAAAKALTFHHELFRWLVAGPPVLAGLLIALDARARWRSYESAMRAGAPLPVGRSLRAMAIMLAVYAAVAVVASALD